MAERRVGPCRYLAASKPRKTRPDVNFYRCRRCGRLLAGWPAPGGGDLQCCGETMERLEPVPAAELPEPRQLNYEILGGPNENAVRAVWTGPPPDWLYLETFRGGQYLEPGPRDRRAVFALAGEDAYAYCDKDPCEECGFRCKNGFVLYGWWPDTGLTALPLNRIGAISGPEESRTRRP